jgi:hypothetical protein
VTGRPSTRLIQAFVLIFIATYLGRLIVTGKPLDLSVLGTAGIATALAGGFTVLLDNWLWRAPGLGRLLTSQPNVRGLWHGELATTWTGPEGKPPAPDPNVFLVVRQRYWSMHVCLLTSESASDSLAASFVREGDGPFRLVATYRNTPRPAVRKRSEPHHGTAVLDVSGNPARRLSGAYYTDRETRGELDLMHRANAFPADWESACHLLEVVDRHVKHTVSLQSETTE